MLEVEQMRQFDRDIKRLKKQGKSLEKLKKIINLLVEQKSLDAQHRDHVLVGNYRHSRECHIAPNWLLIYRVDDHIFKLLRTGSHSELFN